jgi:hypothetical protein
VQVDAMVDAAVLDENDIVEVDLVDGVITSTQGDSS